MPDSLNFFFPEHFASLRCSSVSVPSKDVATRVIYRKVAKELVKGALLGDLNGTSTFPSSFSSFRNGLNIAAILLTSFSVVAPIWLLGHILSCN